MVIDNRKQHRRIIIDIEQSALAIDLDSFTDFITKDIQTLLERQYVDPVIKIQITLE